MTAPSFPAFVLATFTGMVLSPASTLRNLRDVPARRVAGYYGLVFCVALILMAGILFLYLGVFPSAYPPEYKPANDLRVTVSSTSMAAGGILAATLAAILVLYGMAYLCGARSGIAPVGKSVLLAMVPLLAGLVIATAAAALLRNGPVSLLIVAIAGLWVLYLVYLGLRELVPLSGLRAGCSVVIPVIILVAGILAAGFIMDTLAQNEHRDYHRYVTVEKAGTVLSITSFDNPHTDRPVAFTISVNGVRVPETLSPVPGSRITVTGTEKKDQVIVIAAFPDGTTMVVYDAYV
jgi:hypothetical protein